MRLPGLVSSHRPPRKALRCPLGRIVTLIAHCTRLRGKKNAGHSLPGAAHLLSALPGRCWAAACDFACLEASSLTSHWLLGGSEPGVEKWPADALQEKKITSCHIENWNKVRNQLSWGWYKEGFSCADYLLFMIWVLVRCVCSV